MIGRPTDYEPGMVVKVYEYLEICKDTPYEFHKTRGEKSNSYEEKIKVNLPTVEGLATYIGCNKTTIYEWAAVHDEFSNALEKIKREQHDRLVNNALSGSYNSTIAKLLLSHNHGYVERKDITTGGDKMTPNDEQKHEANKAIDQLLGGGSNKNDTRK